MLPVISGTREETSRSRSCSRLLPPVFFPKRKQCIIYPFVMTDVVLKSGWTDSGAMNRRHLVAIHGGMTSGFEVVHGLLDHVMVRPPAQTRPRSLPSRFLSLACAFSLTLARCVQCTRHTRASHETFFFCFDLDVVVRWLSPCVYVFYVFCMKKYMGSILSTHTV
jgi:hypothetical protein